jgi:hypothetical protein
LARILKGLAGGKVARVITDVSLPLEMSRLRV